MLVVARTGGTRESSVALLRSPLLRFEVDGIRVSLEDAAAFYTDELTTRGWEPADTTSVGDATAVLAFAKDDSDLTVVMHGGVGPTKVTAVTTGKPTL